MAKVLVAGGAGYVGGNACAWLMDHGHDVWILDDLSTGHAQIVESLSLHFAAEKRFLGFTRARVGDTAAVTELLSRERFDCVMHFAAKSLVSESVAKPDLYYECNVLQTRALLEAMLSTGTRRFIFSSTCAIFGDPGPAVARIHEAVPKSPLNPYGSTKLEVERTLEALARDRGLQAVALRYFNAAGADDRCRVGEWHEPETHLIPNLLKAALKDEAVQVFGTDYPTPDGTAIRDYIHVMDLASAHEAAMKRLLEGDASGGRFEAYNLGSENGFSVREMVSACEKAIGRKLKTVERPRRPGDPPRLVGDSRLARQVLGFEPGKGALDRIFATAWAWEQKLQGLQASAGAHRAVGPAVSAGAGKKAVFLDRDGTINVDPGYLSQPEQMKLLPGAGEALACLRRAGFVLIVVTNQSGVGRGIIKADALPRIHERLDELLAPFGAKIDRYENCVHHPEVGCDCRKPKAKLLLDSAKALGVDLSASFMVGDKLSDLQAGRAAGCRASLLVRTGYGAETERVLGKADAAYVGDSLIQVAEWILGR